MSGATEREPVGFRLRLTLQTLTRGDGLLGLIAMDGFGPRSSMLTVARFDWAPATDEPAAGPQLDTSPEAEVEAREALLKTGLRPLPPQAVQWRSPLAAVGHDHLWSLPEESQFADFWAEQVPRLQARGWAIVVRPGFAHQSVVVDRWRLVIDPASGDEQGRELVDPLGPRVQALAALRQPPREGSFMLSLGVEVEGETLDLAPMIAELLKRDARWLDARAIAAIDDAATIVLHAPGGRRIEAAAAPLKVIIGAMLDLLTDPRRRDGPLRLSSWEVHRLEALRLGLIDAHAARVARVGAQGAWQLQGEAGLAQLAQRLSAAGGLRAVPAPAGLGLILRPYQLHGVAWLQYLREQHLAGILADDMGWARRRRCWLTC